jgi:hypothetical protein
VSSSIQPLFPTLTPLSQIDKASGGNSNYDVMENSKISPKHQRKAMQQSTTVSRQVKQLSTLWRMHV